MPKLILTAALLALIGLSACQSSSYRSSYPETYSHLDDATIAQIQPESSVEDLVSLLKLEPVNHQAHEGGELWIWVEFTRLGQRSLAVEVVNGKSVSYDLYQE